MSQSNNCAIVGPKMNYVFIKMVHRLSCCGAKNQLTIIYDHHHRLVSGIRITANEQKGQSTVSGIFRNSSCCLQIRPQKSATAGRVREVCILGSGIFGGSPSCRVTQLIIQKKKKIKRDKNCNP